MENIDELLSFLPKYVEEKAGQMSGFCLRYSISRNIWIACYGVSRAKRRRDLEQMGFGENPFNAIIDLIEKIKKYKYSNKYEVHNKHKPERIK